MTAILRDLLDPEALKLARVAGERAHNLFETGQLLCSEAVLTVVNRALGGVLSDDLAIRLAACLPQGIGDKGCVCGALSGGVLALGLFLGRDRPGGRDKRKAMHAAGALHGSFQEEFKSTCCRSLSRKVKHDSRAHMRQCAEFTRAATEMVVLMILKQRPALVEKADWNYLEKRDSRIASKIRVLAGMARSHGHLRE
jgi:C_GCAxxG_C_C family probable redox protein